MSLVTLHGPLAPLDNSKERAIMTTQIKLRDLLTVYKLERDVNRDVNGNRLPKLTKYIDGYDMEPGIFFPAIVCAYSGNPLKDFNVNKLELEIPHGENLVVIDGQHRIKALEAYINNARVDFRKRHEVLESDFTLQIYFGLNTKDMKNLFADINSNSVKVSMSLITAYDNREISNIITKETYEISMYLQMIGVEFNKSKISRPQNQEFITSARLKKFISILLFGKPIINNSQENLLKEKYDEILSFLERFFYVFINDLPESPGDVLRYVLGHEAIQNAIALLIHNSIFEGNSLKLKLDWEERIDIFKYLDWSPNNKLWQPFIVKARANSSSEYLTIESRHEKDIYKLLSEELKELI